MFIVQCLCSFAFVNYCFLFNNCVTFDFSESEVTFPVRMTRPVTPLLYISHNKSELLELRKHVFIKDAHEGKNNLQELFVFTDAKEITANIVFRGCKLPVFLWLRISFLNVG